jgi:hypothetical protein
MRPALLSVVPLDDRTRPGPNAVITTLSQRWRGGRASYRPAAECIDPFSYEVAPIDGHGADRTARAFVEAHHYSRSMPAARERVGLYRGGDLVGVAVFSHPASDKVLSWLPCPKAEAVELGRFVLLDDVEHNGETWFLARAFELLRQRGYSGVISFADPVRRATVEGAPVFPGHIGTIYQAANAVFAGEATMRTLRLLPDGRVFSERARSKIRQRERGWQYAVEQLLAAGAPAPTDTSTAEALHAWLLRELPRCTRGLLHPGNYRYLFGLTPAVKRHLPKSRPYPKFDPR